MILTGSEIAKEVAAGRIVIDPFDPKRVNPNSYNLRLSNQLVVYDQKDLGLYADRVNPSYTFAFDSGMWFKPGLLYLGSTVEVAGSDHYAPMIEGRSSVGRLGISIHATAGFGDIGFRGRWTLEISVVQPVWIVPGIEICQIVFHEVKGDITLYRGRYQGQQGAVPSLMHLLKDGAR